ncbi:MAG: sigma-70 family RNA polymerase sigma factor [Pyrinomonadaceae bacterium]
MVITGEDDLIRRAQAGDAEAFCQLAKNYERRIYSLALHYCRDSHDAEDLSQEVWLKVYKSVGSYRGEASFYTWLRRITIHSFLNHQRANGMTHEGVTTRIRMSGLEELPDEPATPHGATAAETENGFHRKILAGRVMSALGELTPQQRLMFLLKHREGMTYQEIGESLGCSAGSVKKSLYRSVLKLRAALGVVVEAADGLAVPVGENG